MFRPSLLLLVCLLALLSGSLVLGGSKGHHNKLSKIATPEPGSPQAIPPGPGGSTLVNVQVISRHGTRAPNPVVADICPSDRANLARYGDLRLTLAGLTGTGQKELYALGVFTRQTYMERAYPHFLSSFFNDEEVYFRAVGEDRTIQSAICMGQGMYPKGTAAIGYFSDLPSPVPIYTLPDEMDSLLEVRKKGCASQLKKDAAKWDATEGIKLYTANQPLIQRMLDMCNITDLNDAVVGTGDNYGDAIKDITDAWTFDMIEGFPPQEGLNYSSLLEFRTMAVDQLLGRIIGTEEQITYMNGQLPERMVTNFQTAITNQGPNPASTHRLKMYAYHGHREMMYALGAFLGIDFDIKFPGLPKGAIPPGTTFFFELHYTGERLADGSIPNAWEANGMINPYLHRMVLPEDMPKKHKWGAPIEEEQPQQPQQPATDAAPAAATTNLVETDAAPVQDRRLSEPTRGGQYELNGAKPEDTPTPAEQGLESPERNATTESGPLPGQPGHSVLPHPAHARPGNGLVKIPDALMPPPPMKGYTVRAFLWHPCDDASITEDELKHHPKHSADCPATPIIMSAICDSYECTMEEFHDKMEQRVRKTGTWDTLCKVHPNEVRKITADVEAVRQLDTAALVGAVATAPAPSAAPSEWHLLRWLMVAAILAACYVGFAKYRASQLPSPREEYVNFPDAIEPEEVTPLQRIF